MKAFATIVLLMFASFGDSIIITCNFQLWDFGIGLGIIYECDSMAVENSGNLTIIEEIRGSHMSGKTNANVLGFWERSGNLNYIPSNLNSFFPNIRGFHSANSPLLKVSASDLQPFPNLVRFSVITAHFTSIEGDLFQHTRNLRRVEFNRGRLTSVGENLIHGLNQLTFMQFFNPCLNFTANTPDLMLKMKQNLLLECRPLYL
jgi:hypothetical protein